VTLMLGAGVIIFPSTLPHNLARPPKPTAVPAHRERCPARRALVIVCGVVVVLVLPFMAWLARRP
jgi:hypothetical protein